MSDIYDLTFPPSFFEDEVREGFYVFGMMKRFWAGNLKILSEIAKICRRHELPWFVICGTLLGTVRHGGYVPWDDDLDIIMKREDLQRFLEVAPSELPEGYWLKDVQRDPSTEHSIAHLMNWRELTGGVITEFYGCPYSCGVDIFALDGRYPDEASEKKRRERYRDILVALKHVTLNATQTEGFRELIRKIERENHCHIIQDELIYGRLCGVINQLYREVPLQEDGMGELFHGIDDHLVFPVDCFREAVWMPFEHIRLPVPAGYQEVLRVNYGEFMRLGRQGSAHDYPAFAKQEKRLEDLMGHHPFRYTYAAGEPERKRASSVRDKMNEMLMMLRAAAEKAAECRHAGDEASALQLETACRSVREALCNMAELNPAAAPEDTEELALLLRRRKVLFLAVRASWWKTYEPFYRMECERENTDVTVACVPWYEVKIDLRNGERHDESALFPEELSVVPAETAGRAGRIWDVIYMQFPFDNTNQAVHIDEPYTSAALREMTDHLVYVPCFAPAVPGAEDRQGKCTLRYLVEQPAVVHADEVCLPSEEMRKIYVEEMTAVAGEQTRPVWENKIRAYGEKADAV
ncbi:MAG: LicD family protein [Lachnospiraceae bacterium]|nr:LicD family protein [Lachnospiraceae bacterium]